MAGGPKLQKTDSNLEYFPSPMNILFFTDHMKPEPSAPAAHIYERARLWCQQGHRVTIMAAAPNAPEGKVYDGYKNRWRQVETMDGIRVVRVKTFIAPNQGAWRRILDYVSYMLASFFFAFFEAKPDVVISSSPHLFVGIAGTAFAHLRRLPHVLEVRDLWPASIRATGALTNETLYQSLERVELALYRLAHRIVVLSPAFIEDLTTRGVPQAKISLVINGANLHLFSPRASDADLLRRHGLENRFVVGYLGTLGLAHGLENVLDTALRLQGHPITFLFVGAGAAGRELEARALDLGLDNVVFVPRQSREEMPRFWSICSVALVHLRNDPVFSTVIPSKIFEAMAAGKGIIYVGPLSPGSAIVEKHDVGVVVPAANPQALADAVKQIAAQPDLVQAREKRAVKTAPLYSREAQARGTLDALMAVCGGVAAAP